MLDHPVTPDDLDSEAVVALKPHRMRPIVLWMLPAGVDWLVAAAAVPVSLFPTAIPEQQINSALMTTYYCPWMAVSWVYSWVQVELYVAVNSQYSSLLRFPDYCYSVDADWS
jgi:hypothetical protein